MKSLLKPTGGTRSAFTLIELLVALGVTALLVSLMLTIVVNVMSGWNKTSGTLTTGNQARLVLDQISRDLQSAIIKRDGNGWIVATVQQNQTGTGSAGVTDAAWVSDKPSGTGTDPLAATASTVSFLIPSGANPSIDDYRFGQGGVWLRFFTNPSDINNGALHRISAPRAVAYQIVRMPVVSGSSEIRYQLFRSEVRPGHSNATLAARSTFAVGYDLLDANSLYNQATDTNSGVLIASNVDEGGEPGSIRRPDRNQLIANNVIDFGVRFWVRDSTTNQLVIRFPVSTTNIGFAATTKDGTGGTTAAAPANYTYGFPEVAEVFIRVLTDEGVNQIANLESGRITGTWWDIALANSRVYSRRVEIKGQGF